MLKKIEAAALLGKGITPLADTPGLSSAEMRSKFDELALEVIVPSVNNNVDALTQESAADEIGTIVPQGVEPEPPPKDGQGAKLAPVLRGIVTFAKGFAQEWAYSKEETEQRIDTKVTEIGTGDMAKAVYDTNRNGSVDNADKLGGNLPSYYQPQADSGYYLQERLTGNTWIDGKPIYTKTIVTTLPTPPASEIGTVQQGFGTGSVNVINYQILVKELGGLMWDSSGLSQLPGGSTTVWFRTLLTPYQIYYSYFPTTGIMTPYTVYLTLKYTK